MIPMSRESALDEAHILSHPEVPGDSTAYRPLGVRHFKPTTQNRSKEVSRLSAKKYGKMNIAMDNASSMNRF